ncbi:MAG: pentapeptide repeat-containing protein, partial [Rhizobiaceae bacterium]|nr:pentapeptide repeat-containing protein [Rhizobiaceae bacterium]
PFYVYYDHLSPYFQGVAIESAGVAIEVVLLVVALGWYEQRRASREAVSRLRERIEDVKRINDPHAHGIIAASIRNLAKLKLTDIDLRGSQLTDFSFHDSDIQSLVGAVFADGLHLSRPSRNFAKLVRVDFRDVDCTGVLFGSGDLSLSRYEDCLFWSANLKDARFEGATLKYDPEAVVADQGKWREQVDTAEDGTPLFEDVYLPPFHSANLEGCSFKGARLRNVDFREAYNVDKADFAGASGLETCFFDQESSPRKR